MFQLYLAQFALYAVLFLFFGIPLAAAVFFLASLILYLRAKGKCRAAGSVDNDLLKKRRIRAIVSGVIAAVLVAAMAIVIWLFFNALSYM